MSPFWDSLSRRDVRYFWMRTGITVEVSASDKVRLEAIVAARGSPQKHVWRARIILLTEQGLGTTAIMAATGKSETCVWRWRERFMAEGVDGLLRDKTRPPTSPCKLMRWSVVNNAIILAGTGGHAATCEIVKSHCSRPTSWV